MVLSHKLFSSIVFLSIGFLMPSYGQQVTDPNLKIEEYVEASAGLDNPVGMVFVSSDDALVIEKNTGKVKRITNGVLSPTAVLDLSVATAGEAGLTGITLSPSFETDSFIYLFYVSSDHDGGALQEMKLSRFTWADSVLDNETLIYSSSPSSEYHFGGVVAFGPPNLPPSEQKLFIGFGDQTLLTRSINSADSPRSQGSGMVLRLNQDGSIPSGTDKGPFYDVAGTSEIRQSMFAYGIRNIFGLAFDPVTNHLWDTENGEKIYDEVNIVRPAFNSGYLDTQGPDDRLDSKDTHVDAPTKNSAKSNGKLTLSGIGTYTDPIFSWRRCNGVAGMRFLSESNLLLGEEYKNDVLVAAYNYWGAVDEGGKVFRFKPKETNDPETNRTEFHLSGNLSDKVFDWFSNQDTTYDGDWDDDSSIVFAKNVGGVTNVTVGPDGAVYLVSNSKNAIYRVVPKNAGVQEWNIYE